MVHIEWNQGRAKYVYGVNLIVLIYTHKLVKKLQTAKSSVYFSFSFTLTLENLKLFLLIYFISYIGNGIFVLLRKNLPFEFSFIIVFSKC